MRKEVSNMTPDVRFDCFDWIRMVLLDPEDVGEKTMAIVSLDPQKTG